MNYTEINSLGSINVLLRIGYRNVIFFFSFTELFTCIYTLSVSIKKIYASDEVHFFFKEFILIFEGFMM